MERIFIPCDRCGIAITDPSDLMVTALWGLIPKQYHRICYAEREKEVIYQMFYQAYPVNFGMGNLSAGLSPLLALFLGITVWNTSHSYLWTAVVAALGIWPLTLRLIVYWKWERHISRPFTS